MNEIGNSDDGFALSIPKLPGPEIFGVIEANSDGGDIFGPSTLSCVFDNIATGRWRNPLKPGH